MRNTFAHRIRANATRKASRTADEQSELALLAEFMRHDSVAALAGAMAERLGGTIHEKDLIAGADLGSRPGKS